MPLLATWSGDQTCFETLSPLLDTHIDALRNDKNVAIPYLKNLPKLKFSKYRVIFKKISY